MGKPWVAKNLSNLYDLGWQDFSSIFPNLFLFIKANMGHSMQIMLYWTGFEIMDNRMFILFLTEEIMNYATLVKHFSFCLYKKMNNERGN